MSVVLGQSKSHSANKLTSENPAVTRKHSKAHRSTVQENPVVKRVDSSKPVLAQRHVLGDLSNKTSREKENRQQSSKPQTTKKPSHKEVQSKVEPCDDPPEIEYMPPPVNQEPAPYQTPSYFKGLMLGAMRTNPFRLVNETISTHENRETATTDSNPASSKRSSLSNDLPGLFYQLDIGSGDWDLPDIDELNL